MTLAQFNTEKEYSEIKTTVGGRIFPDKIGVTLIP
jgi:hypothetical protein